MHTLIALRSRLHMVQQKVHVEKSLEIGAANVLHSYKTEGNSKIKHTHNCTITEQPGTEQSTA